MIDGAGLRAAVPTDPFAVSARGAGVLLHPTSLPSRYGIGDLGPAARAFIDRLSAAGVGWWQMLPHGPTGFGNSPYQSLCSFAGNELLISPEELLADGLIDELPASMTAGPQAQVDFAALRPWKLRLLEEVWARFSAGASPSLREAFEDFRATHATWLEDYALFRALKAEAKGASFDRWTAGLAHREAGELAKARERLRESVDGHAFAQFLFFRQWAALRDHARARAVGVLGDLPFFVAADSADVWTSPECFLLDAACRPDVVAGVPPDAFSADGQRWGNPIYDWSTIAGSGFRWAIARVASLLAQVDLIRLDHFRGFAAAWEIPAGSSTARIGRWVAGPGQAFFDALEAALPRSAVRPPLVAEDLGVITADVIALRKALRVPGTRVLQFGFDGAAANIHHPDNLDHDVVAYTGTHDNPTTRGWIDALATEERARLARFLQQPLNAKTGQLVEGVIEALFASRAALVVVPAQDILLRGGLGNECRMNSPGRPDGNWSWRCTPEQWAAWDPAWLAELTAATSRSVPIVGGAL
jgi:4-alpha-glucanotransferase